MKNLITISILLIAVSVTAQDVHFSQFWYSPTQVNPAQAGVVPGNIRLTTGHRNQWASVASPFKTFMFNGEYKIEPGGNTNIGTALYIHRDVAGDTKFSTTKAQAAISGIINLNNNNVLSIGVLGGILQKSLNPTDMMWGSQYQNGSYNGGIDPGESINMQPGLKGDVSAGIMYMYHADERYLTSNDQFSMQIGFSYNHITAPKTSWTNATIDTLHRNMIAHGQFNFGVGNSKLSILPGFLVMLQGPSKEILAGSLFRYRLQGASKVTGFVKGSYVSLGSYIRFGDAIIPTLQFGFDKYEIGMSYDLNASSLRKASNMKGGFEIMLKFMPSSNGFGAKAML